MSMPKKSKGGREAGTAQGEDGTAAEECMAHRPWAAEAGSGGRQEGTREGTEEGTEGDSPCAGNPTYFLEVFQMLVFLFVLFCCRMCDLTVFLASIECYERCENYTYDSLDFLQRGLPSCIQRSYNGCAMYDVPRND